MQTSVFVVCINFKREPFSMMKIDSFASESGLVSVDRHTPSSLERPSAHSIFLTPSPRVTSPTTAPPGPSLRNAVRHPAATPIRTYLQSLRPPLVIADLMIKWGGGAPSIIMLSRQVLIKAETALSLPNLSFYLEEGLPHFPISHESAYQANRS